MSRSYFDAVIFDLDGVITQTASVHSAAWKKMFDEFLMGYSEKTGRLFREFTHTDDYLSYVDGKPRYVGVASFLASRGIDLPYGDPTDAPDEETICGLGNKKNLLFNEMISRGDVEVFTTTVDFIKELRGRDIKVGVASSSKNAKTILDAAGLSGLFDTRVDGIVSSELGLKGKPDPDIFTTACDNLGVSYDRAVVVEDAVSGVQAGCNGNFGLILGIARENNEKELKINGADIVIKDMGEISCEDVDRWFSVGLIDDMWTLNYFDYAIKEEGTRETLCTVGNGYFGTRGALEENEASETNYPGTYIAGVYNRLESEVVDRIVVNEDFVNCPNWLPITYKLEGSDWLDINTVEIIRFSRRLDFRDGVLHREVVVRDDLGRETLIESSRFASMAQPHLAALKYSVTPLNHDGVLSIRSGLNGRVINAGVERYRQLSSKHLEPVREKGEANTSSIVLQTNQSAIQIAQAAKLYVFEGRNRIHPDITHNMIDGAVYSTFEVEAKEGHPIHVEKVVAIYTSKDEGVKRPLIEAQNALYSIGGFDELHQASAAAWADIWAKIDIHIEGDRLVQKLLRLNQYHSMISASPHNVEIDAGIPARGLHGEAYRGHIFWDEIYILPLYAMHFPNVARSVLLYRYRRLNQAKAYAEEHGYKGAMFPWQSGSDGREETQVLHLNPISGMWGPDYSSLQRHISLAIAYNIWQYWLLSNDIDFLEKYGAEMFLEICRFWVSKTSYNGTTKRHEIDRIMGPDEYHEQYPGSDVGGLKNNSYTNIMVVWLLNRSVEILNALSEKIKLQLMKRIELSEEDLEQWNHIAGRMCVPLSENGILEQFEGYFKLKELDWDAYRKKYGDIRRLDRILKAEGNSPDAYKIAKQADALMAFYILGSNGVAEILKGVGYPIEGDLLHKNFSYYFPRTSHGSTLSNLVHSYLAYLIGDRQLSWQLYLEALKSDYVDIQGGTTKEGAHIGVMAGTMVLTLRMYAGLNLNGDWVCIDPRLPKSWRQMHFNLHFKGDRYSFVITPQKVEVSIESLSKNEIDLFVCGRRVTVRNLIEETIELPEREQI